MRGLRLGLIGAGLVLSLGGMGAGGGAFYYTNAATDAAVRFFRTLAAQGAAAAYDEASAGFRTSTTEPAFAAMAERSGLLGFRSVLWSVRSVDFGAAELTATLTLADGRTVVAPMRVVRDAAGTWQVAALDVRQGQP